MKRSYFVQLLRKKQLLLPPLSGYTDYPYRVILAKFHPPFLITEMANARAILQKNRRTMQILQVAKGNHYNGVQLVGSSPEYMRKAAQIVQDLGFDYIDINMGCAARKVASRGEGITMMKNETRACEIVTAITSAVEVPVTCKMRLGVSKRSMNVTSLSQKLVDAGATALTIHARSGEKKFGVPQDRNLIKKAASMLSVPVIANGNIYTGVDAQKVLHETSAAAVMPGRGLLGNPWLIPEILTTVLHQSYVPPSLNEKKEISLEHLDLLVEFYGERRAILKMRSILPYYFSSCVFLKNLKKDVQHITTAKEISFLIENIQEKGNRIIYR